MTSATFDSMSSRRSFKSGTLKNREYGNVILKHWTVITEYMDGGPKEQDTLTSDTVTVNYRSFFR